MTENFRVALLSGTFELPFTQCELRQCGSDDPTVYTGPGIVSQDSDGSLVLRMFGQEIDSFEALVREFASSDLKVGVIVPDTEYFDLSAVDGHGKTWTAKYVAPRFEYAAGGTFIRIPIRRLETSELVGQPTRKTTARIFIPTQLDLPWHGVTHTDTGSSRDRFEFEKDGFSWCFRKVADGVDLSFSFVGEVSGDLTRRLLRGVSILSGRVAEPLITTRTSEGVRAIEIHSRSRRDRELKTIPPLDITYLNRASAAHEFLATFLTGIESASKETDVETLIYGRWHRVLRVGESDIENSSLVLSVAVETILKEAFATDLDVDQAFVAMLKEAVPRVVKAGFDPRVQQRILSSFGHAQTPTATQVLRRLVDQGVITADHVDAWTSLRHASAHGDIAGSHGYDWQKHFDRFYACLGLFYLLVFVLIRYRGPYRNLSVSEWPTHVFPMQTSSADQE